MEPFYSDYTDEVYQFTKGKGAGFRIDCQKSEDAAYRSHLEPETKAYYLQVQNDKVTYANVCYPERGCTIGDLVEAICRSIESGMGQYIIP